MRTGIDNMIDYAFRLIGTPYKWGGSNPISGIDCSGLCQELLQSIGEDFPGDQSAQAFYDLFMSKNGVLQPNKVGLPGAFAFYGKSDKEISHITFMINTWQTVGADGGGSKVNNIHDADFMNAFVKIRPVDYRQDLVAIVMPNYRARVLQP